MTDKLFAIGCSVIVGLLLAACDSTPASNDNAEPVPPPVPKQEIIEVDTTPPISEYEQTFIDSGLVDIQEFIPGILINLKYSTTDNFVHTDVYGDLEKCYLRPEAAEKLKKAQELLQKEHPSYSLLVFDGVRPHRVQYKMWEVLDVPNKRNYLSPPDKGSVHNYG